MNAGNSRIDFVKQYIGGDASKLSVLGISPEITNGRHHQCPRCGGAKFRISHSTSPFAGGCDSCKSTWGDVVGLVAFVHGIENGEAARTIQDKLSIEGSSRGDGASSCSTPSPVVTFTKPQAERAADGFCKHKGQLTFKPWSSKLASQFVSRKSPITIYGLNQAGAKFAQRKQDPVIAVPIFCGPELAEANFACFKATGSKFKLKDAEQSSLLAYGRTDEDRAAGVEFDRNGVFLTSTDRETLLQGEPVENLTLVRCEGVSDFLGAVSLTENLTQADRRFLIFSNSDGCRSFGCVDWFLPKLAALKPVECWSIGDQDVAGQLGSIEWCEHLSTITTTKNVQLPFELQEKKGKDLRDYFDGRSFADLVSLANETPIFNVEASRQRKEELKDTQKKLDEAEEESKKSSSESYSGEEIDDPHRLARINILNYKEKSGGRLIFHKGHFLKYRRGRWSYIDINDVEVKLTKSIRDELESQYAIALEFWKKKIKEEPDAKQPKIQKITRNTVANTMLALKSLVRIGASVEFPSWITEQGDTDHTKHNRYLSFTNGILNFDQIGSGKGIELEPLSSNWVSLNAIEYDFDLTKDCPKWIKYLDYTMEGDQDRIAVLQEWAGYCLYPSTKFQRWLVLEGSGQNGKSVFLSGLRAMLGSANISDVAIDRFGDRFALQPTIGKMINISPDLGQIDSLSEGIIKSFTGGDVLMIDVKMSAPISSRPTAKIIASWNERPRIKDRSQGMWRRLLLVPFTKQIPPEHLVRGMDEWQYWQSEAPGILNWALFGLTRLLAQGEFTPSKKCQEALADYREESNPCEQFLSDHVEANVCGTVLANELYQHYREWCHSSGYQCLGLSGFGRELFKKFPKIIKSRPRDNGRASQYTGILFRKIENEISNSNSENKNSSGGGF